MAISAAHFRLMVEHRSLLPRGGDVLQIGDANWYTTINPRAIFEVCDDNDARMRTVRAIESGNLFLMARAFYAALFAPKSVVSIDINGSDDALRLDLNQPLAMPQQCDLSVNHGTAEHVFHIAQVFGTMHAWTKPGGLMIHESPWLGWPDHGFYSLHPTLFYDLAAANGYEVVSVSIFDLATGEVQRVEERGQIGDLLRAGKVPENATLFVVFRHGGGEFRLPMQGIYDGTLSEQGKRDWRDMR